MDIIPRSLPIPNHLDFTGSKCIPHHTWDLDSEFIELACTNAVDSRRHDECGGNVDREAGFDGYDVGRALSVDLKRFAFLFVGVDGFGIAEDVGCGVRACDGLVAEVGCTGCLDGEWCVSLLEAEGVRCGCGGWREDVRVGSALLHLWLRLCLRDRGSAIWLSWCGIRMRCG